MEFPKLVVLFVNQMKKRAGEEALKQWINARSESGYTAIHYASFRGDMEVIHILINNGAIVDLCNNEGLNVLHLAAQGNKTIAMIYFVEKYKMDIMKTDNIGSTPLHWASYVGSEECFLYIMTLNPDINRQDIEGLTPLHLAVTSDRSRIIKKLLHKGADKNIRDKQNRTPFQLAIEKNKIAVSELLSVNACCNFCAVKAPLGKLEKSNQNIIAFIILHFFFESLTVFCVLPCN